MDQLEYQAEALQVNTLVLPGTHELYPPVSELHDRILFTQHADDVPCHPSRARYPVSDLFCLLVKVLRAVFGVNVEVYNDIRQGQLTTLKSKQQYVLIKARLEAYNTAASHY